MSIQGVYDLNGNKMVDTTVRFGYKEPEVAQLFDVLITEIMSDPVPSIDLPNVEYLELFNNSDKPINLNNWSIGDASRTVLLDSFALMPQTFVVLCDEKVASAMADFGAVLPVNSMPTLNNSGDSLTLYNSRNQVISHVKYSTDWHRETWKQTGGWSLELRDLTQPCGGRENWNSSRDTRGGTPGALNSINEVNGDFEAPTLTYATITGWQTVELNFSESIMSYHPDVSDFNIIGHQIKEIDMPNYKAIRLTTENKFELGEPYEVLVSNIMDCAGNRLLKERTRIAIPEQMSEKDLLVNEILFNPIKGGVDFVEIYNHGKKILDLSDLFVARKGDQGDWTDFKPVVDRSYLIFPGDYVVLTSNAESIQHQYPRSKGRQILETLSLPPMPNDSGNIYLTTKTGVEIDGLSYSDEMHFELITNEEGVSLERRSFVQKTDDPGNWTSASYVENYATPGYRNSQFIRLEKETDGFSLGPDPISPNGDGYNDALLIHFTPPDRDMNVNIRVFDQLGRIVSFPVNTALAGERNIYVWDGVMQNGQLAPPGIYVVHLEALSIHGSRVHHKKGFTLIR